MSVHCSIHPFDRPILSVPEDSPSLGNGVLNVFGGKIRSQSVPQS